MSHNLVSRIQFCFPAHGAVNQEQFVDSIVREISNDDEIGYAGYATQDALRGDISWRFDGDTVHYQPLTDHERDTIEAAIHASLESCYRALPASFSSISVFVFPLLEPYDESDQTMGYVSGYMPYERVIHVFVAPSQASPELIANTVAHEYNHTVFFHHHPSLNPQSASSSFNLLDVLIWEGLALHFEEHITKRQSPIISTFTKAEVIDGLANIKPFLSHEITEENTLYETVFFGGGSYKKWLGYVLGYFIVQSFMERNPECSWTDMVSMNPHDVFKGNSYLQ